jgi:ketosteroid isomerase-like protein
MSIRERVGALVREVEAGRFVEAIDASYAEDASSHESTGIDTTGKPALLAKERAFLTTVEKWNVIRAVDVLVDGQMAAIHWRFELTIAGKRITMEEVALQHWRGDGDSARVVREQYFAFPPGSTPR